MIEAFLAGGWQRVELEIVPERGEAQVLYRGRVERVPLFMVRWISDDWYQVARRLKT